MKITKLALVFMMLTWLMSLTATAKSEMKKAYIFGAATSFNDSTVYFTDIQEVDSAWFSEKNHFLISRENYSSQLRDFLSRKGETNQTCIVVYSFDRKKIEQKWNKLHTRYATPSKGKKEKHQNEQPPYQVKLINNQDFSFQGISPTEDVYEEETPKTKKEKKSVLKKMPPPKKIPIRINK